MHLYDINLPSGNAYKVHLLLSHLSIPYETTTLDIFAKPPQHRTSEFLAINPNGRVPVLVLDNGTALAESNAILCHLAEGTPYLPQDKLERAQVLQWMFWEQDSHKPNVAGTRFNKYWGEFRPMTEVEVGKMREKGQAAIDVMEKHLEGREWFVGDAFSVADIALFAYTQCAENVGFAVGEGVKAWLQRVVDVAGHIPIKKDPLGRCPL